VSNVLSTQLYRGVHRKTNPAPTLRKQVGGDNAPKDNPDPHEEEERHADSDDRDEGEGVLLTKLLSHGLTPPHYILSKPTNHLHHYRRHIQRWVEGLSNNKYLLRSRGRRSRLHSSSNAPRKHLRHTSCIEPPDRKGYHSNQLLQSFLHLLVCFKGAELHAGRVTILRLEVEVYAPSP